MTYHDGKHPEDHSASADSPKIDPINQQPPSLGLSLQLEPLRLDENY